MYSIFRSGSHTANDHSWLILHENLRSCVTTPDSCRPDKFRETPLVQNKTTRSSPLLHIFSRGPRRIVRSSQVTLMESANLVRFERTNHAVQDATVVEEDEVLLLPVVRVDQLKIRKFVGQQDETI